MTTKAVFLIGVDSRLHLYIPGTCTNVYATTSFAICTCTCCIYICISSNAPPACIYIIMYSFLWCTCNLYEFWHIWHPILLQTLPPWCWIPFSFSVRLFCTLSTEGRSHLCSSRLCASSSHKAAPWYLASIGFLILVRRFGFSTVCVKPAAICYSAGQEGSLLVQRAIKNWIRSLSATVEPRLSGSAWKKKRRKKLWRSYHGHSSSSAVHLLQFIFCACADARCLSIKWVDYPVSGMAQERRGPDNRGSTVPVLCTKLRNLRNLFLDVTVLFQ